MLPRQYAWIKNYSFFTYLDNVYTAYDHYALLFFVALSLAMIIFMNKTAKFNLLEF